MYDKMVVDCFIKNQEKLIGKKIFFEEDEAREFLEDCMASICDNVKEVKEYLDDIGMDMEGMSDKDILESEEVFLLPNGKFLIVEG